ncbi:MAG: type II toxin-antitoxin system RelB/DinJ family antitoxin [Tenericutes bacterium]|nr:type II toxin-antitoxin system RelB/DinJ family antitoxin [Mycoplasmatota bacterium]
MAKTAYINVRVEEAVKLESEGILNELGINTSTAIDLFLKQIIIKDGIPFDIRLPKQRYESGLIEIAKELNIYEPYPNWLKKIAMLYARNQIDLEIAIFAAKKQLNKS